MAPIVRLREDVRNRAVTAPQGSADEPAALSLTSRDLVAVVQADQPPPRAR